MPEAQPKTGVLMVNLGTPDDPSPSSVRRYLKEFLSDIRVVDAPRLLWWFILRVILIIRPRPVSEAYMSIWTPEGSPLMVISEKQAKKLRALLSNKEEEIPLELAMTYGSPSVSSALSELRKQGVKNLIVLPMYPQYSSSTTAAVFDGIAKALSTEPEIPAIQWINHYYSEPDYIKALGNSVREHWEQNGRGQKLIMSFHGVPKRYTLKGDPYEHHCRETAVLLAKELKLSEEEYICTFQSRFGREEWLKPYTDMTLKDLPASGTTSIDVICPAFSADCLETLEEIQVENREYFEEAGGKQYSYINALNDRDDHIQMLHSLIRQHIR